MKLRFYFLCIFTSFCVFYSCHPLSDCFPHHPHQDIRNEAMQSSDNLDLYITQWAMGLVPDSIPEHLIPSGITECSNFVLKNPENVGDDETWIIVTPCQQNKDSIYPWMTDPHTTYLYLATPLAPFGSKLIIEGEFPHCRFFSIQASPPLSGFEYSTNRIFGPGEISIVDVDIEPLQGSLNPFRAGANRNVSDRSYRIEFNLVLNDGFNLKDASSCFPYRSSNNQANASLISWRGPEMINTINNQTVNYSGPWNMGSVCIRICQPDDNVDALGGVSLPRVYYELPTGQKYFISSDFSHHKALYEKTFIDDLKETSFKLEDKIPSAGWYKAWSIQSVLLMAEHIKKGYLTYDEAENIRETELAWTGKGEFQPAPANCEAFANKNNFESILFRPVNVSNDKVLVLTGKLPVFPSTKNGEQIMKAAQVRYLSISGVDYCPSSPAPAATVFSVSDNEILIDEKRNYIICLSDPESRPKNATNTNGITWVNYGNQNYLLLLLRIVSVFPDWSFQFSPSENNLTWQISHPAAIGYNKHLIGMNSHYGFMKCYLPRISYMSKHEFEQLGDDIKKSNIPAWIDKNSEYSGAALYNNISVTASSVQSNESKHQATNVIDANTKTDWSSAWDNPNQWICLDLDTIRNITDIRLVWDWIFYAVQFHIEISDNQKDWKTIITEEKCQENINLYRNLNSVSARYVRLKLTQPNFVYYRLCSFEIYTDCCEGNY